MVPYKALGLRGYYESRRKISLLTTNLHFLDTESILLTLTSQAEEILCEGRREAGRERESAYRSHRIFPDALRPFLPHNSPSSIEILEESPLHILGMSFGNERDAKCATSIC